MPAIVIEAEHDGTLETATVHDALSGLDVSETTPVTPSGREVVTTFPEDGVVLKVDGDSADFTKKSQTALKDVLKNLDAVDAESVTVTEGGYSTE